MTCPRVTILQEIAREEQRLAELDRAHDGVRGRLESLRSELTQPGHFPAITASRQPTER